ncbi:hypothetical protein EJ08DRAFT_322086 [Tothia fuscella]|uniref:Transmembrane protein n=1 Tax=Tothia fuscella TaxID=1048955 RepID=A0A9P4TWJ6_9PEZI|nr:hypothetical protein EJ08DRAFT_322086 [Tothia fuscella]
MASQTNFNGSFAPNVQTAFHKTWSRIVVRTFRVSLSASLLGLISHVFADQGDVEDESNIDYNSDFIPKPSNSSKVVSDVGNRYELPNLDTWRLRANRIRSGNRVECLGNLSLALAQISPVYQAEAGGASGALTLLPTAGALIGAPAKELWVLYKLVPIAGLLSMLLSLGGNIVPQTIAEYEKDVFSYGGMIASGGGANPVFEASLSAATAGPTEFAEIVRRRAYNDYGSSKRWIAFVGITAQICWITLLLVACYLTQAGSILVWWCQAWGWMYFWYAMVAFSSLLENFAATPFSRQWTIRVSRAPSTIEISDDAPRVVYTDVENPTLSNPDLFVSKDSTTQDPIELLPLQDQERSRQKVGQDRANPPLVGGNVSLLKTLKNPGINTVGQVVMPHQAWTAARHSFYVIISVTGISHSHAALRVLSKGVSVGAFAAGTATFASATLITITVTVLVLCLILGAGVLGRVAALWMVSEFTKEQPIVHRTVHTIEDADQYIQAVLEIPGLTAELMGHVFINGRCIHRYNDWWSWATLFGILTGPFRPDKIAIKN